MKIAAFADAHIGCYGSKLTAGGHNARLLDTMNAVGNAVSEAMSHNISHILFAGDLFRTAKPSPTEIMAARQAFQLADEQRTYVLMIPGNHDLPRSAAESSPLELVQTDNVALYDKPNVIYSEDEGWQLATLPYPNRARMAAVIPDYAAMSPEDADNAVSAHLETVIAAMAANLRVGLTSILMAHISIDVAEPGAERGIMAGRDITIPLSAIPEAFDFVALGHIHYAQDFARYGRPNVFYCGSTSRLDFGEEGQEKSFVVIDTEAKTWERVPIQCREFQTVPWIHEDGEMRCDHDLQGLSGAICRAKIFRPESVKPDYDAIRKQILDAGAHEFTGFVEDVTRVQQARSEEIAQAVSLSDLLTAWSETSNCEVALDELVAAAQRLEAGA